MDKMQTIKKVQIRLAAIGLYHGFIDGIAGPLTWNAVFDSLTAPDAAESQVSSPRFEVDGSSAVTPELIEFVEEQEGFTPKAFWDYQQWTNGYGTRGGFEGETITKDAAEIRLKMELGLSEVVVDRALKAANRSLTVRQRGALISFGFNTGKAVVVITECGGAWDCIAEKMKLYIHAGNEVLAGLVKRRAAEIQFADGG